MSNQPCISVIVAVYNVEQYVAQCCHALFAQTLENLEFVFIDDGSQDNSLDVVRSVLLEYPDRFHQVKIIEHEKNLGISKTRKDGVKNATGEYIIHCDPDDWIELNMYEKLYSKAISENADMVICDLWYHNADEASYGTERPKELSAKSILASCLYAQHPQMHCYLWNKLIKSFYYHAVEWPENISFCEDVIACSQILSNSSLKISYVNQALYHYRIRESSLSKRQYTKQNIENDYEVISLLYSHLEGDPELYRIWQACVPFYMLGTFGSSRRLFSNKEYKDKYRRYRNCIWQNKSLSAWFKLLFYFATYNYFLSFALFKGGLKIKNFLHQIDS